MTRSLIIAAAALSFMGSFAQAAEKSTINIGSGSRDGLYYPTIEDMKNSLSRTIKVNNVETAGSEDNYRLAFEGTIDGFVAQNDARNYMEKKAPEQVSNLEFVAYLKKDYVHLICNRESGINKIKDFYGSTKVLALGPPGSGSAITWDMFGKLEARYTKIKTQDLDFDTALTRTIQNDVACMLWVAGLNSNKMKRINELGKGHLQLVPINDGDLDNAKDAKGKPIYTFDSIPGGTYYNLQYGMFGTSVKTISQSNVLAITKKWKDEHKAAFSQLSEIALRINQQNQ